MSLCSKYFLSFFLFYASCLPASKQAGALPAQQAGCKDEYSDADIDDLLRGVEESIDKDCEDVFDQAALEQEAAEKKQRENLSTLVTTINIPASGNTTGPATLGIYKGDFLYLALWGARWGGEYLLYRTITTCIVDINSTYILGHLEEILGVFEQLEKYKKDKENKEDNVGGQEPLDNDKFDKQLTKKLYVEMPSFWRIQQKYPRLLRIFTLNIIGSFIEDFVMTHYQLDSILPEAAADHQTPMHQSITTVPKYMRQVFSALYPRGMSKFIRKNLMLFDLVPSWHDSFCYHVPKEFGVHALWFSSYYASVMSDYWLVFARTRSADFIVIIRELLDIRQRQRDQGQTESLKQEYAQARVHLENLVREGMSGSFIHFSYKKIAKMSQYHTLCDMVFLLPWRKIGSGAWTLYKNYNQENPDQEN